MLGCTLTPPRLKDKSIVERQSYPTPAMRDYKGGSPGMVGKSHLECVAEGYETKTQEKGLRLSPRWVEWLMGFPDNWTSLEDIVKPFTNWDVDPADVGLYSRVEAGVKERVNRLKCCGNGVVPQQGRTAWKILKKM